MIFIDTSVFISYFIINDPNHEKIKEIFNKAYQEEKLVTGIDVVVETINWLTRKSNSKVVQELGNVLLSQELVRIINTDNEDRINALAILRKYSDQIVSFTDAISFTIIKRFNIQKVFSLDKHFNLIKGTENIYF